MPKLAVFKTLLVPTVLALLIQPLAIASPESEGVYDAGNPCDFYKKFEAFSNCGELGYLLNYGLRNCRNINKVEGLTPAGIEWRSEASECLRRKLEIARIQGELDSADGSGTVDCKKLSQIAFNSHSECYVNADGGRSFCDLPLSDKKKILGGISAKDLFSTEGALAAFEVASKCIRRQ